MGDDGWVVQLLGYMMVVWTGRKRGGVGWGGAGWGGRVGGNGGVDGSGGGVWVAMFFLLINILIF